MSLRSFRPRSVVAFGGVVLLAASAQAQGIGEEKAVTRHLADGEEFTISIKDVNAIGSAQFQANWTIQEGGGRPLTKGNGNPLKDPTSPLVFPRNFNRISTPDANSCAGCHNAPFGIAGGGGDFVTSVFVLGQRFDFTTFDHNDLTPTRGAFDEAGKFPTMQEIANSRATLSMNGSGFIEMLARQMTAELQAIRDGIAPSGSAPLKASGVDFGTLSRAADGSWNTSLVTGLAPPSLVTTGPSSPPSLILRPFHQAGNVISLRQFTNNAMNHHHGIQPAERFGSGADPDGDGFTNEMTIADVTATSVYQATLAVPGRVIPNDAAVEDAIAAGEDLFVAIGCVSCHKPYLELRNDGWVFSEPNPFNPSGNLRPSDAYVSTYGTFTVDMTNDDKKDGLPLPRLKKAKKSDVVRVPAFTDLKLHDVTSGPTDPNREALNMQFAPTTPEFFAGNSQFVTKKLWGSANEPPFFHHGQYTTLRQAVNAHAGEAAAAASNFAGLSTAEQNDVIEFLKTLRVLPAGTKDLVVDENGKKKKWRDFPWSP